MIDVEVVLPRRVRPQPMPALYAGGDCGACVLGGIFDLDVAEVYERLNKGKPDAFSWSCMRTLLWTAQAHGLLDRLVDDVPSWAVPEALRVWGSPSFQQSMPWIRYLGMALDAGYYGVACVDSRRQGPHSEIDHWVLVAGWRRREVLLEYGARIEHDLLISDSSTAAPAAEAWVDHRDFLRAWGGFNVLLVRPAR